MMEMIFVKSIMHIIRHVNVVITGFYTDEVLVIYVKFQPYTNHLRNIGSVNGFMSAAA